MWPRSAMMSWFATSLITFLWSLTVVVDGSTQCKLVNVTGCTCEPAYLDTGTIWRVDCKDKGLTKVPYIQKGPLQHMDVDLRHNMIIFIPANAFHRLVLRNLDLSDNRVAILDKLTFQAATVTGKLRLDGNALSDLLPNTFRPLSTLNTLKLGRNKFTAVRSGYLDGLVQLESLFLDENKIESVSEDAFIDLRMLGKLDFSNNRLRSIPATALTAVGRTLGTLDLSYNFIGSIQDGDLTRLGNIHDIDLSNNELKTVSADAFRPLPTLWSVDLSYNFIDSLGSQAFDESQELTELRVQWNCLRVLRRTALPEMFVALEEVFNLTNNRLDLTRPKNRWLISAEMGKFKRRGLLRDQNTALVERRCQRRHSQRPQPGGPGAGAPGYDRVDPQRFPGSRNVQRDADGRPGVAGDAATTPLQAGGNQQPNQSSANIVGFQKFRFILPTITLVCHLWGVVLSCHLFSSLN